MLKHALGAALIFLTAALPSFSQTSSKYGLPENIQDGNILHCFCWPINTVTENLEAIAEAGFGAVQLSPLQRKNVSASTVWYDPYRPFDYAFQATSGLGSQSDLQNLCTEAAKYGIKVIVDVVANHVDKTSGYHDAWWDSNSNYVRSKGGSANINYGNRRSITHDRLGDYYELNTENADVIARAKSYVQQLRDLGVSGIRWDAAKHIELPSEGSRFWSEVTSVEGMFHYGEILGAPGPDKSIIGEYAKYMSVTDSEYSDNSAKSNGGIPSKAQGDWASTASVGASKVVYWGESHDTYSNTPDGGGWSTNISQSVIDRAYASVACRNGSTALYFSRPSTAGFNNIKIAKGTDAFQGKAVKEVNKFRNKMADKAEATAFNSAKTAFAVTRRDGGAVIVMKTEGNVSIANAGGYLAPGNYTDRVTGTNQFTVMSTTIEGAAGPTGIVVLYNDDSEPIVPDDTDYPSNITVYFDNSVSNWDKVYIYYWGGSESGAWPGVPMTYAGSEIYYAQVPEGSNAVFNNGGNGRQTVNVEPVEDQHVYKALANGSSANASVSDEGLFDGVEADPDDYTIYYDNTLSQWAKVYCHYWGGASSTTWAGDAMSLLEGETAIFKLTVPKGSSVVFNNGNNGKQTEDFNNVKHLHIYQGQGTEAKTAVVDNGVYTEASSGIGDIEAEYDYTLRVESGCLSIDNLSDNHVVVAGMDGRMHLNRIASGNISINLTQGIYIVNIDGKGTKVLIK